MLVGKKVESGHHRVLPHSLALYSNLWQPIGLGEACGAAETALAPWVGADFPPMTTLKVISSS